MLYAHLCCLHGSLEEKDKALAAAGKALQLTPDDVVPLTGVDKEALLTHFLCSDALQVTLCFGSREECVWEGVAGVGYGHKGGAVQLTPDAALTLFGVDAL